MITKAIKKSVKVCIMTAAFLMTMMIRSIAQPAAISPINQILNHIKAPQFKGVSYDITAFGAVADGKTDIKPILDKVIAQCSTGGGGHVIIPKGSFYIGGPVVLKSHVDLHFDDGAELVFSADDK